MSVKLLRAAALLIGNIIIMPIFGYIHMWEKLVSQKNRRAKSINRMTTHSSGQFTRAGFRIRSNRPVRPAAELKRYVE